MAINKSYRKMRRFRAVQEQAEELKTFLPLVFILTISLLLPPRSADSNAPLSCRDPRRACSAFLYYELPSNESIAYIESLFNVGRDDIVQDSQNMGIDSKGLFIRVNCSCFVPKFLAKASYNATIGSSGPLSIILDEKYEGLAWAPNESEAVTAGTELSINLLCGCPDNTQDFTYLMSYVVSGSDTLTKLSDWFNSSVAAIMAVNNITDKNVIFTGQVYFIPINGELLFSYPARPPESLQPAAPAILPMETSTGRSGMPLGIILAIAAGVLVLMLVVAIVVIYARKVVFSRGKIVGSHKDPKFKCSFCTGTSFLLSNCLKSDADKDKGAKRPVTLSREMMTGVFDVEKPVVFSYEEVVTATDQFKESNMLGQGAFGSVYYGILRDQEVAIKRMKATKTKEFLAEMKVLCKVHHTNLIDLIGFASNEEELFLVYEYAENRAVSDRLHDPISRGYTPLTWNARVQIALDTARGLEYIHEHTKEHYVHRDVKTSNILLDSYFRAKVADFGLAKLLEKTSDGETSVTRIVGTFGYLAPEYLRDGQATAKSDVYAFGVVLFELLTGREAISRNKMGVPSTPERRSLISIMLTVLRDSPNSLQMNKLLEHVDSNLMGMYPHDCLYKMAKLAQLCVEEDPVLRPDMKYAVFTLSQILLSSIEWEAALAGNSQVFSGLIQGR